MTDAPSVILIGLDGGTFDLIDPWVRAGELPAIASLLEGGARTALRSTHPPLTPVAWSSLLTGCNPGKHGIFGFLDMPGPDHAPRFLSGGSLSLPTVLEILSARGVRVGALNVPWTWPPRPVNGFCLSGLDAPAFAPDIAHPRGLFEEVVAEFGGYFDKTVPPRHDGYALDRLDDKIDRTGAIARYLMREHPVQLFAVVFVSTDHVQHWFWQDRSVRARDGRTVEDLLHYTYARVDEQIGRILDECAGPDRTVILMSDHGAGPTEGGLNLGRWLAAEGWLRPREQGGMVRRLRRAALSMGGRMLPGALRERLRSRLSRTRRGMLSRMLEEGIDWPETRAFCWSDYGNISLNLQARFDDGTVSEGRREALVAELAEALMAIRHPESGARVMSAPLRPRDVYHGDRLAGAPDLLAIPRGYRWEILTDFTLSGPLPGDLESAVFAPARRQATHRPDGILCLAGRRARSGFEACGARIEDLAPTVLHLMGQPVPEHMDGRVLSELLAARAGPAGREPLELPAADGRASYSDSERRQVERDLQGLGYL